MNAAMIKPEALSILQEKFSSRTRQLVESGVSSLFSGFRKHPVNIFRLLLVFFLCVK